MHIREATPQDWDGIWPIFKDIVRQGTTYAYDRHTTKEQAQTLWLEQPRKTFVAEINDRIVGTYYLKTNQIGAGSHVCNCGYMVCSQVRGQGIASALCQHSQQIARQLDYLAMQFNFVASSNQNAVRLWHTQGFETVGTLPKAFNHPKLGFVDAY